MSPLIHCLCASVNKQRSLVRQYLIISKQLIFFCWHFDVLLLMSGCLTTIDKLWCTADLQQPCLTVQTGKVATLLWVAMIDWNVRLMLHDNVNSFKFVCCLPTEQASLVQNLPYTVVMLPNFSWLFLMYVVSPVMLYYPRVDRQGRDTKVLQICCALAVVHNTCIIF